MSPGNNPPNLSRRTIILLLTILIGVGLFALLMGIWHCIRKRNVQKRIEQERQDIEAPLQRAQLAAIAPESQLPERRSAKPKPKLKLTLNTNVPAVMHMRSAPVLEVGHGIHRHQLIAHPLSAHPPAGSVCQHGGHEADQI